MVNEIIAALKLSLAECNKYEDPARYIFEINEVLSRYKTNLYLASYKKYEMLQDPKEIFNFRISASWIIRPSYGKHSDIAESSLVLLHVNGLVPVVNERVNKERTFNKTVDISDVVYLERIALIKTDWYERQIGEKEDSPEDILNNHPEVDMFKTSICFDIDRGMEHRIALAIQIGAVVNPIVERNILEDISRKFPDNAKISTREIFRKKIRAENALTHINEPVVITSEGLNNLFTQPQNDPDIKVRETSRMRGKNYLVKSISAAKMRR